MADQLQDIVGRMVAAGESEADIAAVIRQMSAPEPQPALSPAEQLYEDAAKSKGFATDPSRREAFGRMSDGVMGGGVVTAAPTAVGAAVQQFAPGVSRALKGGAERVYGGLLKVKDATLERFPNVVQDLLKARAPISQGGRAKVIAGLRRVGAEKDALLKGADERAMVPRETFRRGLDGSLDDAIKHSDTPVKDMGRLAKIEKELIPDEPGVLPSRADKIKTKLQSEADRGFRGAKLGVKTSDTTARAKMAVSGEAKQALEAIEPRLQGVNAAYGSGKGQAQALREALKRTDKHSVIGLNDLIGAGVGSAMGGPAGGAAGWLLTKILGNANTGSRVAIGMNELSRIPHLDQAAKAAILALGQDQDQ